MQNLCLWKPDQDRMQHSNLHQFMAEVNHFHGLQLRSYADLYQWSVEKTTRFWPLVWQHCGVKGELGNIVAENRQEMQHARWFPDSQLNFAENLLRRQDESPAIISRIEGSPSRALRSRLGPRPRPSGSRQSCAVSVQRTSSQAPATRSAMPPSDAAPSATPAMN